MANPLLTVAEARARILAQVAGLSPERVAITDALGRVLAENVVAAGPVPPFASSAMDGYGVVAGPAGRLLRVIDESRAGRPATKVVTDGEAIRISTGAVVPSGATAVIPQEDADPRPGDQIELRVAVPAGAHIRQAGEDMRARARVLSAGTVVGPAELGAAVAAGAGQLQVARRPTVAVLCTGDELRAPGEPLGPGAIHNSNGPMLTALAQQCGAVAETAQRLPDDRRATEAGLAAALIAADVVLISGGVSVGPHDQVKPALRSLGVQEVFWGVALQPGKPIWFGRREDSLVFGLPGNPVSTVVTFTLFVRMALSAMLGLRSSSAADQLTAASPQTVRLGVPVVRNRVREQALRVRLEHRRQGLVAIPNGPQGSHVITSLLGAQALALIPPGEGELPGGSEIELEPLPL